MTYKPILEPSHLPPIGPLPEDLRFDMKMLLPKGEDDGSLACDVAAFANTSGGVLLIGAHEHPSNSGILSGYVPVSYADCQIIAERLKRALRLCSPKPIAEAKPLELNSGKDEYVVAINCDAYASPPIGVSQSNQSGGEKWWAFPVRRGRDNRNLRPEELATIMEPRLRRILLLLDRLPRFDPDNVRRAYFHSKHEGGMPLAYDIVAVNVEQSAIRIRSIQRRCDVIIPLDALRMIWQDTTQGVFHVSLDGDLMPTDAGLEFRH